MRQTLRSHIHYLENAIQDLRTRLSSGNLTVDELQDIELQLAQASSALEHYQKAYALELEVFGPEPPDASADHSKGGSGEPGLRPNDKKKEGLAAAGTRKRKRMCAAATIRIPVLFGNSHVGTSARCLGIAR